MARECLAFELAVDAERRNPYGSDFKADVDVGEAA